MTLELAGDEILRTSHSPRNQTAEPSEQFEEKKKKKKRKLRDSGKLSIYPTPSPNSAT